ncbi:MAG TPA: hypothetical protein VHE55_16110 [Fimbriimonadaceae bacterium]|nr:hypothetical protein [Fimbriimonadaceae bacterium]
MHLVEQRLVVEKVLLRGTAGLEEVDDPLGFGGVVDSDPFALLAEDPSGHERGQGHGAEPPRASPEELAAGQAQGSVKRCLRRHLVSSVRR